MPAPRLYVQYGCGDCAPEGWVNFDASPRLRMEKLRVLGWLCRSVAPRPFAPNVRWGNICRGLPIADGAAAGVYCSHVIEHIPRGEVPHALAETRRILAPGGAFRLVMPDLNWRARRYAEAAALGNPAAADDFVRSCLFGAEAKPRGLLAVMRRGWALSEHLWMYDYPAIRSLLEQAGFVGIRSCTLGDSADPMFALVEERNRFFDGSHAELAVEAFRPA